MPVTVVRDQRFMAHDPGPGHPECPARIQAIELGLQNTELSLAELAPRVATKEELLRVHTEGHLDRLETAEGRNLQLDPDTICSPDSVQTAYLAAGATIELCSSVAAGKSDPGLALLRPPGHHAPADRAMGFCLLNNVAIAAKALIAEGLAERIAIYDWDVHHGNGSQDIFYEDPQVLYLSTHQWPFYPGTGAAHETGAGAGEGATLNCPLPGGTTDEVLLEVNRSVLIPKVRDFAPDMILISAGFDPFEDDPIGGFQISEDGFTALAGHWRELAESICKGRIAGVLEGGYDLSGLSRCVQRVLKAWES